MTLNRTGLTLLASTLLLPLTVSADDWLHWRGPEQNGVSRDTTLPESFELDKVGENNLLWKAEVSGRSAPIVMNGKLFIIGGYDASKTTEGEHVVCYDAATGEQKWETKFGVFHTDIVSSRLGWTTLAGDPKENTIFAHTTAGDLVALDAETGKTKWKRQLTEEFGRVTGYGGRISSPVFDEGSGLVLFGFLNSGWGDMARGGNRFFGFDGKTGDVVWMTEVTTPTRPLKGTYSSTPVIAVVNGQRLMICGGSNGSVHALKVRTGEEVWSYHFSNGIVDQSPVVDGNLVYCTHGESNPEGGVEGRVICLDASKVTNGVPKLVWEFKDGKRFGLASPALTDGRLYCPENGGELYCFDAATGKKLWDFRYGTTARGAPLVVGKKVYIFEVNGKLTVIPNAGNKKPDELDAEEYFFRFADPSKSGFPETNGTPIAVNGKLYFQTAEFLYCVGSKDAKPTEAKYKPLAKETPFDPNAKPAGLMVVPAVVTATQGEEVKFTAKFVDANGRELSAPADTKVEWTLPLPPKTPTGAQPPSLDGTIANGVLKLSPKPGQNGNLQATAGGLTSVARVRAAPTPPVVQNFDKVPVGAVPGGWVNTQGKYSVEEVDLNGKKEKVLSKANNNPAPPIARANAYITTPNNSNYTVQADVYATEVDGKLPDMGLVANRCLLVLEGKRVEGQRNVTVVTWEARNRINKEVLFNWKKDTWYTMKFTVEVTKGKGVLKGKVWQRGTEEPKEWTITAEDPNPNTEGAAALYGYVPNITTAPGSSIYYDNVSVTPNK